MRYLLACNVFLQLAQAKTWEINLKVIIQTNNMNEMAWINFKDCQFRFDFVYLELRVNEHEHRINSGFMQRRYTFQRPKSKPACR